MKPEESLLTSGTEARQILKVEPSVLEIDQGVPDEESRYIMFGLLWPNHLSNWREIVMLYGVCFYEFSIIESRI